MSHSASLTAALDRVYTAFAAVPRPVSIDACSHCFDEEETAAILRAVPLRDLDEQVVRTYFGSLFSTVGEEADFRYFLPRLLEMAIENTFPDMGHFCSALWRSHWRNWAPAERAAIDAVLRVLWTESVRSGQSAIRTGRLLEAFADAAFELSPYLGEWTAALEDDTAAAAALIATVRWSDFPVQLDYDPTAEVFGESRRTFVDWLYAPETRRALTESAERLGAAEARDLLDMIAGIESDAAARASRPETNE